MKTLIRALPIIISIFSCLAMAVTSTITPDNTIIVSSIDNVLVQKNKLLRYASWMNMHDEAILDRFINKLSVKLLSYGATHPSYAGYTARLVNHIQQSYCIINETALIYDYLKQKGYTFAFTTNKDHFSYRLINEEVGNKLNNYASAIFVSPSQIVANAPKITHLAQQPDTPELYTALVNKLTNHTSQGLIHITPINNTDLQYYHYIREKIDQEKNILFIDESLKNINLFASTQTAKNAAMTGILFETPLLLVQKCIELGILSIEEDKPLIETIEAYDRHFKKLLNTIDRLFFFAAYTPQISRGIRGLINAYNEEGIYQNIDNINDTLSTFIKQQLFKTHNIVIKGVKIASNIGNHNMGIGRDYVFVSPDTEQMITEALHTNDQNTLDQWQGVLEHEGNHVKNNDLIMHNIARILSPFITHGSTALLAMISAHLFKHKKHNVYRPHEYEKILTKKMISALRKNILSRMTFFAFSRYTEQRADNQISNDVTLLKAIKTLFESWQEPNQSFVAKCYSWFHNFFETHPLLETRIQKFEERIALLQHIK